MSKKAGTNALGRPQAQNEMDADQSADAVMEAIRMAQEALRATENDHMDIKPEDLEDPELLAELAHLENNEPGDYVPKPSHSTATNVSTAMKVDSPASAPQVATPAKPPSAAQPEPTTTHPSSKMDVSAREDDDPDYDAHIKALINTRLREYLHSALKAKELGLPQARNLALTHAKLKDLKKRVEEAGELIDEADIPESPPPLPAEPTTTTPTEPHPAVTPKQHTPSPKQSPSNVSTGPGPSATRASSAQTSSSMADSRHSPQQEHHAQRTPPMPSPQPQLTAAEIRDRKFAQLEAILQSQLEEMRKAALEANTANRKAEAMAIVTRRKGVKKDLELVQFARSVPGTPPPAFHIEVKEEVKEIINEDLSQHEIEVGVLKLEGVKPPSVSDTVLECYIQIECPFPDVNKPTTWTTNTVSDSLDPVFKHSQRVRIERNKALGRTFEKKKITFLIYKPKSWFLGSARALGRAELKLAPLCTTAEVHEALDVLDADGHKLIGGKMHIFVRLRSPLLKTQVTKETHKILVIDQHFIGQSTALEPTIPVAAPNPDLTVSTVASLHGVAPSENASSSSSQLADSTFTAAPSHDPKPTKDLIDFGADTSPAPKNAEEAPTSSKTEQSPETGPTAPSDAENFDWNSARWMISHAVLEWRQGTLKAEIAQAKAKKLPEDTIDELSDKLDDVAHKIDVLFALVQSGKLTQDEYIRRVKEKIGQEEELALRLASINRNADAKLCHQRIKIMKEEIGVAETRQQQIDAEIAGLLKRVAQAEVEAKSNTGADSSALLAQYEDKITQLTTQLTSLTTEVERLRHENKELKKEVFKGDYRAAHLVRELEAAQGKKS